MEKLKTNVEIKKEIKAALKTIQNFQEAYDDGEIPIETLNYQIIDNEATIEF